MDIVTDVSKVLLQGYEPITLFTGYTQLVSIRNNSNTKIPLGVYADSNSLEVELKIVSAPSVFQSTSPLFLTDDESFVIRTNNIGNIEVQIGNVVCTSNTVFDNTISDVYVRVTCGNGIVTLYLYYYRGGTGMEADSSTTSYSTLPSNNQQFCVFGSTTYASSGFGLGMVRIKKNNILIYDGVAAKNSSSNGGFFDKITKNFVTPSKGSVQNVIVASSAYGTFYYSLAETIDCAFVPWKDNSAVEGFSQSYNLINVTNLSSKLTNLARAFRSCTNLSEVYIHSPNVINVTNICYGTSNTKVIHVPNNSTTYNTFIAAGYDDQGTKEGVILTPDL